MKTAAERLSAFVLDLGWEDIPASVSSAGKLHVLDTVGCGLAARGLGVGGEALSVMAEQGGRKTENEDTLNVAGAA